ncbi:hypothetical protein HDU82_006844 [Entophlyctis luteolus]|nr:hypothetical protein HDU82_006844 [Entophlyctis luteolus]
MAFDRHPSSPETHPRHYAQWCDATFRSHSVTEDTSAVNYETQQFVGNPIGQISVPDFQLNSPSLSVVAFDEDGWPTRFRPSGHGKSGAFEAGSFQASVTYRKSNHISAPCAADADNLNIPALSLDDPNIPTFMDGFNGNQILIDNKQTNVYSSVGGCFTVWDDPVQPPGSGNLNVNIAPDLSRRSSVSTLLSLNVPGGNTGKSGQYDETARLTMQQPKNAGNEFNLRSNNPPCDSFVGGGCGNQLSVHQSTLGTAASVNAGNGHFMQHHSGQNPTEQRGIQINATQNTEFGSQQLGSGFAGSVSGGRQRTVSLAGLECSHLAANAMWGFSEPNSSGTSGQRVRSISLMEGRGVSFGRQQMQSQHSQHRQTSEGMRDIWGDSCTGRDFGSGLRATAKEYKPTAAAQTQALNAQMHTSEPQHMRQQQRQRLLSTQLEAPVPHSTLRKVAKEGSAVNQTSQTSANIGMTENSENKTSLEEVQSMINERMLNPPMDYFFPLPPNARFFIIKSFREDHVFKSIKHSIWSSTEIGNKRLHQAYIGTHRQQNLLDAAPPRHRTLSSASTHQAQRGAFEAQKSLEVSVGAPAALGAADAPVFLFFSVNSSGHFCGVAEMTSAVDWTSNKSRVFTKDGKWEGVFDVRWIYVKDVPNQELRRLRVFSNENKPVTNSRDTQEVGPDIGWEMMRIFSEYERRTCILDDWKW